MQPYLSTSQANGACTNPLGSASGINAMDEQHMDLLLSVINDQQQQQQPTQVAQTMQSQPPNLITAAQVTSAPSQQQQQQHLAQQAHQPEAPVASTANANFTGLLQQLLLQQPQQQQQQQPSLPLQPAAASQLAYACGGSTDLANLLQALASQTAQMQSVILALLKQQQQQQQQQHQQQQVHLLQQQQQQQQQQRLIPASANDSFLKALIAEFGVKSEQPEQAQHLSQGAAASSTLRSILTDTSTAAYAPPAVNLWHQQQQQQQQQPDQSMQQHQLPSADQLMPSVSRDSQPHCLVAPVSVPAPVSVSAVSASATAGAPCSMDGAAGGSGSGGVGGTYKYKRARVSDTAISSSSSPASSSCPSPARSRSPITVVDSDTQLSSIRRDCSDLFIGSASEDEPGMLSGEASSLRSGLLRRRGSAAAAAAAAAASASASSGYGGQERPTSTIHDFGSVSSCRSDEAASSPASVHTHLSGGAVGEASSSFDRRRPAKPSLFTCYPRKHGPFELLIVSQPEQHHRARYMTEGSRGSVKDRSLQGYPTVQLIGWSQPASLSIFVGTDVGRVKPHGYYQACKVSGKSTACEATETEQEGTRVLEVPFDPQKNMILNLDCVGILKLRNADVEQKRGAGKNRKKSIKARLVFRVNLPLGGGNFITLQAVSEPIICTQPVGSPEMHRISMMEGPCHGNEDLFIIGKNFTKGTRVIFQEYMESKGIVWEAEAKVESEYFSQTHLICRIPPYGNPDLKNPLTVQVVIHCGPRVSEPFYFTYKPVACSNDLSAVTLLKAAAAAAGGSVDSELKPSLACVSPMAAQLNKLIEESCRNQQQQQEAHSYAAAAASHEPLPDLGSTAMDWNVSIQPAEQQQQQQQQQQHHHQLVGAAAPSLPSLVDAGGVVGVPLPAWPSVADPVAVVAAAPLPASTVAASTYMQLSSQVLDSLLNGATGVDETVSATAGSAVSGGGGGGVVADSVDILASSLPMATPPSGGSTAGTGDNSTVYLL